MTDGRCRFNCRDGSQGYDAGWRDCISWLAKIVREEKEPTKEQIQEARRAHKLKWQREARRETQVR